MKFKDRLISMNVCDESIEWVGNRGLKRAWNECERADWMLWGLAKMCGKKGWPTHQEIVMLAAWCARRAYRFWEYKEDRRPMRAIQAAERWAKNPTEKNKNAAMAAGDAAVAAGDAANVAVAAAWAASAAGNASMAALAAGDAWVVAMAASAAAGDAEHKTMCDHIRKTVKIGRL